MRDYQFDLYVNGQLSGQGFGNGTNAIDAFENGVEQASVYFEQGVSIEVIAINSMTGLAIKFEARKAN